MKIVDNKIIYNDHSVVCDPDVANEEYMQFMADELSVNGSAEDHINELDYMNNDGTWSIIC